MSEPVRWGRTVRKVPTDWSHGLGAYIHPSARIGSRTRLGCNVYIGPGVVVGKDCLIQSGVVIGEDGFGYVQVREREGCFQRPETCKWGDNCADCRESIRWEPKPHPFGVVIGDDVHIGSGANVHRGSWRDTEIRRGSRVDALTHIAHNVVVGEDCVIVAHAMIAGSVVIDDGAWIGPSASIHQRRRIGARALIGMGAVCLHDVPPDTTWAGVPARKIADVGVRAEM